MTFTLEDAILIATEAHKGQVDKVGEVYLLHPLTIMLSFPPYRKDQRMVAVLHDVIEDSMFDGDALRDKGVPGNVIDAVVAMSKPKGMGYLEFIATRVAANPLAVEVKIADIRHNMSMERILRLAPEDQARLLDRKYLPALKILERL